MVERASWTPGAVVAALAAAVVGSLLSPTPALAQRRAVLDQIKVPHNYYYREMYLPQVGSGPTSVAWSPDGRSLVYSMQGSLWRQTVGSTVAEQLTTGPGYDHQPDWSPDGRWIAYVSYRDDQIELRLLDVETGETKALVSNGAVQLEPRWSPDGRRLAFVSTAYEGRWHVWLVDVADGVPGTPVRITEDRDSGLPRYYYSRFDHYLSPTWSPDGRELIVVSNRGRIWGTGGIWRMAAEQGAPMREIHFEETTWKARPDWSSDGRVVWSSYRGRQWNQLWVMPSEGGDVFPITYGEFDATAPRWSPDGRRIAYVSNERGDTELRVIDVPGGGVTSVEAHELRWREPVGSIRVEVVDAATGEALPARVSVTAEDGRGFVPRGVWRHADDGFDRAERPFEYSYFHTEGTPAVVELPVGNVTLEVMHGPEYAVERRTIPLAEGAVVDARVELQRIADMGAAGWVNGDLHVHMNYGGAYRNDPEHLAVQASAEGLDVIENLIVNKEQRIPDISYFEGRPTEPDEGEPLITHDQEFHTSFWGHSALLGLRDHILLPGYAAYVNTAAASLYPDNVAVADMGHEQGAIYGYVHPFESVPDPERTDEPLTHELPVGVALGKVDYMEIVGFSDHRATAEVWYKLLNCGFHVPAGAGTDAMANFASLRGPVGLGRVYVQTGGSHDYDAWLDGIRAGHTFATNGPLVTLEIDGRTPGDEISLPAGSHRLTVRGTLRSIVPVDHLELVRNGEVVANVPLTGTRRSADIDLEVTAAESGWYVLRAWSDHATHPVLDIYPYATTSPVYVTVGDEPIRSPADARYFVAWTDRLREAVERAEGWNSADERTRILSSIAEARAVFTQRGGGS